MKKSLSLILCLMLLLSMVTVFAGCSDSSKFETFYLYEVEDESGKYTAEDLQKDLDDGEYDLKLEDAFYLKLYENGTAIWCSMGIETTMKYDKKELWQADKPEIKASYTRNGDTIVVQDGDVAMTFKKK